MKAKAIIIVAIVAIFGSMAVGAVKTGSTTIKANHAKIEKILDEAK